MNDLGDAFFFKPCYSSKKDSNVADICFKGSLSLSLIFLFS